MAEIAEKVTYCPKCFHRVGKDGHQQEMVFDVNPRNGMMKWCRECLDIKTRELNGLL